MLKKVVIVIFILGALSYLPTVYYHLTQNRLIRTFRASDKTYNPPKATVHVIGKAAIADYLWLHILEGNLIDKADGFYRTGSIELDVFSFKYFSGPGFIQTTIPQDVEYLVLVLNGRSDDKKQAALSWLEYLHELTSLKKVGVVLLGDEQCQNGWILKYMSNQGGIVDVLFVVYDWKLVDNEYIFQWPLGVATYRGFPLVEDLHIVKSPRKFVCNFLGTVYKNSSRSHLKQIMTSEQFPFNCVSIFREEWLSSETTETLLRYMNVLNSSDFTLCPVGQNVECYRIYEALSFGSIPVIEDISTGGECSSPLRLLKEYNAPFIYLDDWGRLSSTLSSFVDKQEKLAKLQKDNILWYKSFKLLIRGKFIRVLKKKFYPQFHES